MKRTSVIYNPSPSYSHNETSARASANVRRNSLVVLTVGILLIIGILIFISKNFDASLLLSAGILYPRKDYEQAQNDDDAWRIVLGIIGILILIIGLPLSFILA